MAIHISREFLERKGLPQPSVFRVWLPWWLGGIQHLQHLQCWRPRFDPWVAKFPWRREWLPTPTFLPGEFHGKRSVVGYSPWGHKGWGTAELLTMLLLLKSPQWLIHCSASSNVSVRQSGVCRNGMSKHSVIFKQCGTLGERVNDRCNRAEIFFL